MTVQYLSGSFCDVAVWIDGRLLVGAVDGSIFRCYLEPALVNPQPIWQTDAHEALMFCRVAVQGQKFLSVHQGHDSGQAWLVGEGTAGTLGGTLGVQPVAIDAHEAYIVDRAGFYRRIGLIPQSYPFPPGLPLDSSQGLLDVGSWSDIDRTMVIHGVTFTKPNVRRLPVAPFTKVTVGQVNGGIGAAVGGKVTLVIPATLADDPHLAVWWTGRVAICARTGQGAAYVATTIQELSA